MHAKRTTVRQKIEKKILGGALLTLRPSPLARGHPLLQFSNPFSAHARWTWPRYSKILDPPVIITKKLKSFPSHKGQRGGADLRFCSPQLDTSLQVRGHSASVSRGVPASLAPSLRRYQLILLGEQRHIRVNNLPRS